MKKGLLVFFIAVVSTFQSRADRIYIFPGTGYNQCDAVISNAISSIGHTVVLALPGATTLPPGFTSACVDPVNGYHWLCFFGDVDYTSLIPQIKIFLDNGGKVFYQYEVTCCNISSSSAAAIASGLTGLNITPDANPYIALGGTNVQSWEAVNLQGSCARFTGNAYKCLNGLPPANQLNATGTLNSASPPHTTCENFGFYFSTTDFLGTAHNGAFTGVGDINLWYDAGEPPNNGGSLPVDMNVVRFFFPDNVPPCTFYHLGIEVHAGNDTTICGSATIQLNAVAVGSPSFQFAWSPATGLDNPNIQNPDATPTVTTTYVVTATSQGGCGSTTDTITISVASISVNAGNDTIISCGNSAQLNAASPFTISSYAWSPAVGLDNPNIQNPLATPTQAQTYMVTVSDVNGCTASDDVTIGVSSTVVVNAGNDLNTCGIGQVQLNAVAFGAPAFNYTWSPVTDLDNPNIFNPVATVTATTTYIVTAVAQTGCFDTDTITIHVGGPSVTAAPDTAVVCGNPVQLNTVSVATSYSWSPATGLDNPNIANPVATPTQTSTYTVIVVGANGCTASDSVTITVSSNISVDAGNDTAVCSGAQVQLNAVAAGAPAFQFTWSPSTNLNNANIQNPVAIPTSAITYSVTATSLNGCGSAADSIVISMASITVNAGNDTAITCGDSALLHATSPFTLTSYAWLPTTNLDNPVIANPTATPNQTRTYTVTVADANGCIASDAVTVSINSISVIASPDVTINCGASTQLGAVSPNGGLSFAWTPTTTLNNASIDNPIATPATTTTYYITIQNGAGCIATDSVTVTVGSITIAETHQDVTCNGGSDGLIDITVGGATTPVFDWSNGLHTEDIDSLTVNTYSVTVTDGGCSAIHQITIGQPPAILLAIATSNASCNGVADGDLDLTVTGGTPTFSYLWSDTSTTQDLANIPAGNYGVTVTDFVGCTATNTYTVSQMAGVSASHTHTDLTCNNTNDGAVDLTVSGGVVPYIYLWSDSSTAEDLNGVQAAFFSVTVTDVAGCTATDTVTVHAPSIVTLTTNVTPVSCFGADDGTAEAIAGGGTAGYTYQWSTNPVQNGQTANALAGDTYTVTVIDANGCTATATAQIDEPPPFTITIDSLFQILRGESVVLTTQTSTTNLTYAWLPEQNLSCTTCSAPNASPMETTIYEVTATTANGCTATATTTVIVKDVVEAAVPTAFSPNNDGKNDVFRILGDNVETGTMMIFNRWGEKIFETDNPREGWDGSYKDEPVEVGVYAYRVTATLAGRTKVLEFKGNVTLVR